MNWRELSGGLCIFAFAVLAWCSWPGPRQVGTTDFCAGYSGLPAGWPGQPDAGMIALPAGMVAMGSTRGYAEERDGREVAVAAFRMDANEVTNAQFAVFVAATGHVSDAELQGASVVFELPHDVASVGGAANSWWQLKEGHDWRHPDGPGSTLEGRANQPVVHVSRRDAEAYATWLGHRLPSEAEWEYAALAGRSDSEADAALRDRAGRYQANVWQGLFPSGAEVEDGYLGRAPVGCYRANPFGLHDLVGNVWEWTSDTYSAPAGPFGAARRYPGQSVIKGGSYLCAASFCVRARSAARQGQESDLPAGHIGFRTVR